MKHYIICKFIDKKELENEFENIKNIFNECLKITGIKKVDVIKNVIDRPNRYDLMIRIEMEKDVLTVYDNCDAHHKWKELYGNKLSAKTIFDEE